MYQLVGTFDGPLPELTEKASHFQLDLSPSGYGSTSDRFKEVRTGFYEALRALFPGAWPYSMIVTVFPNGAIPPHRDGPLNEGFERHHLILQTNPDCWSFHDGDWQQLERGGIYTMDCTRQHAALNWGESDRIHLVIDAQTRH